jgi:predicted double-glycine peptidase
MQPWLETIGVIFVSLIGITFGLLTAKIKNRLWLIGYAIPLLLMVLIALVGYVNPLRFYQPFSWLSDGKMKLVVLSFAILMLFGTLIPRLAHLREKILLTILAMLVAATSLAFLVIPFIGPILVRQELENLQTTFSKDGICMQTTGYTCGPAAAVTALKQLGIEAQESEIAILAKSTPKMGTAGDLLAIAIVKLYGRKSINCKYRYFNSIDQLKQNCPTIAAVKLSIFMDHYVAVLDVNENKVIIGDPLAGKKELTYEEFKRKWRSTGIVLKKK